MKERKGQLNIVIQELYLAMNGFYVTRTVRKFN